QLRLHAIGAQFGGNASSASVPQRQFCGTLNLNNPLILLAHRAGFEPTTPRFVVWCSIQLSYRCPPAFHFLVAGIEAINWAASPSTWGQRNQGAVRGQRPAKPVASPSLAGEHLRFSPHPLHKGSHCAIANCKLPH